MKFDLSQYSDKELEDIGKSLSYWMWDERIGKKPFMFDKLERYKKPNNIRYRLDTMFRAIWPFNRYHYIKPVMIELARRNIKGYEIYRQYIFSEELLQRLQRQLTSFLNRHHRA